MRRMFFGALAVFGILAGMPASALAQGGGASSTGTIQGRVADASGAVLPGAPSRSCRGGSENRAPSSQSASATDACFPARGSVSRYSFVRFVACQL